MQVSPYLSFKGDCEAAFKFYEKCFGVRVGDLFRYEGSPMAEQAPAGWNGKVMHGSVTVGNMLLMGADITPIATRRRRASRSRSRFRPSRRPSASSEILPTAARW